MAATFGAAGAAHSGGASTDNLTIAAFTLPGTNRNMAVYINSVVNTAVNVSSISRSPDTFAQLIRHHANPGFLRVEGHLYGSENEPGAASVALTVTMASAVSNWCIGFIAAQGGNQTTRMNNAVLNDDHGGTASMSVTTALNDLVADFYGGRYTGGSGTLAVTCDGSQAQRLSADTGWAFLRGSTLPGANTSVTMGWTATAGNPDIINHMAVNFPAAPVPTATRTRLLLLGVGV